MRKMSKKSETIVPQIKCPKCGRQGRLDYRQKGSDPERYFHYRRGQEACYIATIEDIEEILTGKPTISRSKYKRLN